MSRERERRVRRRETPKETLETIAREMARDFEEAKGEFYSAWYDSEKGAITSEQRTARIREVYRRHPKTADDFEELTEVIVDDKFLSVAQLIIRQVKDDVVAERERARRVREEASGRSRGQKLHERRRLAQQRRGTNPRDIH